MDSRISPFGSADNEPPLKRMRAENQAPNLTENLQYLLKSHLYSQSEQLFSEICTLQQRLAVDKGVQPQEKIVSHGKVDVPAVLMSALDGSEHQGNLSPEMCVRKLTDVLQNGNEQEQSLCLLSSDQRIKMDIVMSLFKSLKSQQLSRWSEVVGRLTKEYLPIEVVWQLHASNILSLQAMCDSALKERSQCRHLTKQLIQLCSMPRDGIVSRRILSDVCSHLVQNGFPEKKSEDLTLRKTCISVLDGVTKGLLELHMAEPDVLLHTDLWSESADISHVSFKKFCTHTISLLMSHQPNMKVSEALKRQTEWKSAKVPDNFKRLYKQLLIPFESVEVVEMLRRILEKQEVNWQILLSFLAMFLVCFPSAAKDIQEHVMKLLSESLEDGDMENTIVAFLLARQSCSEGLHVFPTYPKWFQSTFSDSPKSPAGSKKAFTFLLKFLTDLVPYEPADVLKVHILRPPFLPPRCRDLWTDYSLLAKTRLADLKVPLEETNSAIYTDQGNAASLTEASQQDVEKAVAVFESSGKLPTSVMEASIFRKPYFVGKFLPALLQPRHLPDIPDSKMKLIDALKKAGKIPSSLFIKYEEACKRETRQLLEGVFDVEEDDGVEEMMMDAPEQLTHRLKQLTDAVVSQTSDNRISEIVSVISEKIEAIVCPPASIVESANTDCVIDLCQSSLSSSHVQVVDELLNCVCRTVHAETHSDQQCWLHQLERMISQHVTLLPAFFTRLLTLFTSKNSNLSEHHIEGVGAFVFHLVNNMALFPSLLVKNHGPKQQSNASFLPLLLHSLPVSCEKGMLVTLRFLGSYLQTAFLNSSFSSTDVSESRVVLPRQLIVMTCLLSWRFLPNTRPGQQSEMPASQSCHQLSTSNRDIRHETEQDHFETIMMTLFMSEKFQEILKTNQPGLEDWLELELRIKPASDVLSSLQRQDYYSGRMCHFIQSLGDGQSMDVDDDNASHLRTCCSALMTFLVKAMSRCQQECVRCSACQQPVSPTDVLPVNTEAAADLLALLSRLVQTEPAVQPNNSTNEAGKLWIVEQVLTLVTLSKDSDCHVVPEAVLRVVLGCPSYLLFTNCGNQRPSTESVACTVQLMEQFLVNCAVQGGVLSLDVICHLLQGYTSVTRGCSDTSGMEQFEKHPLVVLSTMVHWHCVCCLIPTLSRSYTWNTFPRCLQVLERFHEQGQSVAFTTRDPLQLAASVFSVFIFRDCTFTSDMKQNLILQLHHHESKALGCLSDLLLVSLSDHSVCSASLSHKFEARLQWLSELWELYPNLIGLSFSRQSHVQASLRHHLLSEHLMPFSELACLRCVSCLPAKKIAGESSVVNTVVHIYACLCRRFESGQSPEQSRDVSVLLGLSRSVLSLLKKAPFSSLQNMNQEDVRQCGLEMYHVYQQRLSNGL